MMQMITKYGLEAVVIALFINALTGIIKLPIKIGATKLKAAKKVTRFIVFLPIIIGFLLTYCYTEFVQGGYVLNEEFVRLWLVSSSLSLTFYAIFEKLFPMESEEAGDLGIQTVEEMREFLKKLLDNLPESAIEQKQEGESVKEKEGQADKIVLRGKHQ